MSESIGLSQGNLAYHFPRKRDIILELFQRRKELIEELFNRIGAAYQESSEALFPEFLSYVEELMEIVWSYRFVSIDLGHLTRRYEEIGSNWKFENETMAEVAHALLKLGVKDGYVQPENYPGAHADHIHRMQVFLNFWVIDQMARGDKKDRFITLLYSDISSMLTIAGRRMLEGKYPVLKKL